MHGLLAACAAALVCAGPTDLATLAPPDSVAWVEVREPGTLYARFRGSDLERSLLAFPGWKKFVAGPEGRKLLATRTAWRGISGVEIEETLRRLAARGLAAALVPEEGRPEPHLVVFASAADEDADFVAETLTGLANLATLGRGPAVAREEVGDALVVSIDGKAHAAAIGPLLVVSSSRPFLDAALARATGTGPTALSGVPSFRAARKRAAPDAIVFGFVDAARIAASRPGGKLLDPLPDAGAAFLFGAIREVADGAPFLGISLSGEGRAIRLAVAAPVPPGAWRAEARETFLPPANATRAPRAAAPEDAAVTIRLHRDFAAFWDGREALGPFDDSGLRMGARVLFGGKRFEEDLLPHLGPELDLFLCRRSFEELPRPPGVRFPGGVLVWRLRDPDAIRTTLAMGFQTAIGLANAGRGQEGKSGFLLSTGTHGEATLQVARYLPPEGDAPLPIEFNATPACAVVGDRFYLASSEETLKRALDAGLAPARAGDRIEIDGPAFRAILAENEAPLVANGVLKGKTRDEALAEFRGVLGLLERIEGLSLAFRADEEGATFEAVLRVLR